MIRNEIENCYFGVKFMYKMDKTYLPKFTNYNFYNENMYQPNVEKQVIMESLKMLNSLMRTKTVKSFQDNNEFDSLKLAQ